MPMEVLLNHRYVILSGIVVEAVEKPAEVLLNSDADLSFTLVHMLVDCNSPPSLETTGCFVSLYLEGEVRDVDLKEIEVIIPLLFLSVD